MANPGGWMLFVDGENFTIRAQELATQENLKLDVDQAHYLRDVFVWLPEFGRPVQCVYDWRLAPVEKPMGTRAYYYASVVGDDRRVVSVRRSLRALGFDPRVFKKPSGSQKSKGVDITLTKDVLSHAYEDHYDDAVLIAGDGDYVPLVEEVKRRGKRVYVVFFGGPGLGLAEELQLVADGFTDLSRHFVTQWRERK
jgi:uncharacterized LabA/DUF88 family protein